MNKEYVVSLLTVVTARVKIEANNADSAGKKAIKAVKADEVRWAYGDASEIKIVGVQELKPAPAKKAKQSNRAGVMRYRDGMYVVEPE